MPRYCLLEETAAIEVRGPDAEAFLNAQLTRDVPATGRVDSAGDGGVDPADAAGAAPAPLAAWCDARGRVRAVFRVVPTADGWLLATERSIVVPVLAQLAKYVLRARVTLREAPWRFGAVLEADAAWRAANGLARLAANEVMYRGGVAFVGVGTELVHVASPGSGEAAAALDAFAGALTPAPASAAALAAIRLGLPAITSPTSERFVAQMLNLDVLDAVSFSKGCYPGQEIIARIRYRGEVKRRLKRFAAVGAEPPPPGSEIVDAMGAHVGDVVMAAPTESGVELLAVVDLAAQDVRTADGRALTPQLLPSSPGFSS